MCRCRRHRQVQGREDLIACLHLQHQGKDSPTFRHPLLVVIQICLGRPILINHLSSVSAQTLVVSNKWPGTNRLLDHHRIASLPSMIRYTRLVST